MPTRDEILIELLPKLENGFSYLIHAFIALYNSNDFQEFLDKDIHDLETNYKIFYKFLHYRFLIVYSVIMKNSLTHGESL